MFLASVDSTTSKCVGPFSPIIFLSKIDKVLTFEMLLWTHKIYSSAAARPVSVWLISNICLSLVEPERKANSAVGITAEMLSWMTMRLFQDARRSGAARGTVWQLFDWPHFSLNCWNLKTQEKKWAYPDTFPMPRNITQDGITSWVQVPALCCWEGPAQGCCQDSCRAALQPNNWLSNYDKVKVNTNAEFSVVMTPVTCLQAFCQ